MIKKESLNSLLKSSYLLKDSLRRRNLHRLNVVKLKNRSLLNLKGQDTFQFLQGLITNDIRQFLNKFNQSNGELVKQSVRKSIFSLLLQSNGRTLADFILHNVGKVTDYEQLSEGRSNEFKGDPNHSILLECDSNIKTNLIKLFKIYKLKKSN